MKISALRSRHRTGDLPGSVFFYTKTLILLLVSFNAAAQQDAQLLWSEKLGDNIQWLYCSHDSTLIVAKEDTLQRKAVIAGDSVIRPADIIPCSVLFGIDPTNGSFKWISKLTGLASGIEAIPNVPYLLLRDVPLTIIDPSSGRFIINADNERVTSVFGYGFLSESGHLWVDAEINFGRGLSLFDVFSGKKLWTRYDYFALSRQSSVTMARGIVNLGTKGGVRQTLLCPPINNGRDYMIIATGDRTDHNDLYKVFVKNGDVVWRTPAPDPVKSDMMKLDSNPTYFRLINGPKHLFYVGPKSVMAVHYVNGKSAWGNPLITNSKTGGIIYDKQGLIFYSLSSDVDSFANGRIVLASDTMGLEVWKYSLNIDGGVSKFQYTTEGLAIVTENPEFALSPEVGSSYLNFIDLEKGVYKFEDPIRIPGMIETVQVVPKGLYYSTSKTLNVTDLNGKPLIDIPSHGVVQREASTKVWYYSSQNLFEIDKIAATKRQLNHEKIDFSPNSIEIRKDGVILHSNQNILYVNSDGSTRYHVRFRQLAKEFESATLKSLRKGVPQRGIILENKSQTSFVVFLKNGNESKLSIVSKDTGETTSKIDLPSGSGMPMYKIDSNVLYLTVGNGIKAYAL